MGAVIAAVVAKKEREVVEAFERVGALSPATARMPSDFGVETDGIGWERLHNRAVIRDTGDGRVYLDIVVYQALRRMRRRMAAVMIVLVMLIGLALFFRGAQRFQ